jgi:hypothetical protein
MGTPGGVCEQTQTNPVPGLASRRDDSQLSGAILEITKAITDASSRQDS